MSKWFKSDKKSWMLFLAALVIGTGVGYLYYILFGCHRACPLTSNVWITTGFGLFLGINVGMDFILRKQKKEVPSQTTHEIKEKHKRTS